MPGLTLGQRTFGLPHWDNFFCGQKWLQEAGVVVASATPVIAPQGFGHPLRLETKFAGELGKAKFLGLGKGLAVGSVRARVKAVVKTEEEMEGGMGSQPASGAI